MSHQFIENMNIEVTGNIADNSMGKYQEELRKQATAIMLNKPGIDISGMTQEKIKELLFEIQVRQIELELQNDVLTQQKQQLSESRALYAQLYNLSPVGCVILDMEGVIQNVNVAAACLLGGSRETLLNQKLAEFIHPSDQAVLYFFIHGLATRQNNHCLDFRLKNPNKATDYPECPGVRLADCSLQHCKPGNNRFTYVECHRSVYFNDKDELQLCLTINDITVQKWAQESIECLNRKMEEKLLKQARDLMEINLNLNRKIEELEESRHQFRERDAKLNAIFNAAIEGIITIDRAGVIVSVNAAVETVFGFNQEELIGSSINKIIPVSRSKSHNDQFKSHLQSIMPNVIGKIREVYGRRKDGSSVPLELSVAEFSIDGAGYYTSFVRDVSLRKRREQQDKSHLDELAHVTRLGLMGEMASGIAHEVNQPLAAIIGYTMASLSFVEGDRLDKLKLKEILHKTHDQALRAGEIIHRMRDFVKPKTIYRATIDINDLILEGIGLCASDLKHNSIVQRFNLIKDVPMVYVDRVQIEQVLLNLIRNSIESLNKLPVTELRQLTIQTYLNQEDNLEIRIKDNGPGIAESEQKKIFTPFYTTKSGGMGMGLSISQSIIKAHQGDIYFNSIVGKGATFYFTLPVQRKSHAL
ncbi:MAG: PAS domain-containing sensor histidine kinase [Methylobacter sp.]